MNIIIFNSIALLLLLYFVIVVGFRLRGRSSLDVLLDLEEEIEELKSELVQNVNIRRQIRTINEIFERTGSRSLVLSKTWILPGLLSALTAIISLLILGLSSPKLLLFMAIAMSCGYLLRNYLIRRAQLLCHEEIERSLPLLMEELVMAVAAGHDVISAIKIVLVNRHNALVEDPLTAIFNMVVQLAEAGLSFAESLRHVGKIAPVPAVKHALIHLSLAYQEGGELVMPLRELADATQLMYQEKMEERVAKLPVKATGPLVVIFAGLVIFFVTTPVIQVMKVANQSVDLKSGMK